MAVKWADVTRFALGFPGVAEGTSYGTPALRVGKAFMTRLRPEGDAIVVKMPIDERDLRIEAAPEAYFITDHYRAWPAVLVRVSAISREEMRALVARIWREAASAKLRKQFDQAAQKPERGVNRSSPRRARSAPPQDRLKVP